MLNYGFSKCSLYIDKKMEALPEVPVRNGKKKTVSLVYEEQFHYLDTTGQNIGNVKRKLRIHREVKAPVKKNTLAGEMIYSVDGKEVGKVRILYGEKFRKSHVSGLSEKSCPETVDKKYFRQFYNFLTKDSNPMYNKSKWVLREIKTKGRYYIMKEIRTEDAVGHILCHDITQIIKDVKKGVLFKKGHIVREEDIPLLLSVGKEHLYVWEKKEGILHENEGAEILYKICAGDSDTMHGSDIKEGKRSS